MTDAPTYTVERAAELLHCKRTKVFALIAEGRLERAPKFGRQTVVTAESVLRAATEPLGSVKRRSRKARRRAALVADLASVRANGHVDCDCLDCRPWTT